MKFEVNLRWVVLENLEIDKIMKDHVSAYPGVNMWNYVWKTNTKKQPNFLAKYP